MIEFTRRSIPSKGEQLASWGCPSSYFSLYTISFSLGFLWLAKFKAGKGEVWVKAKDGCVVKFARNSCRSTTSELLIVD
jgi:hypothetical protein